MIQQEKGTFNQYGFPRMTLHLLLLVSGESPGGFQLLHLMKTPRGVTIKAVWGSSSQLLLLMAFLSFWIPGCFHISFFFYCTFQYFSLGTIQHLLVCVKSKNTKLLCYMSVESVCVTSIHGDSYLQGSFKITERWFKTRPMLTYYLK